MKSLLGRLTHIVFIPVILILLWAVMSVIYALYTDISPTILTYHHNEKQYKSIQGFKITKQNKLKMTLRARENHFGIVALTFDDKIPFQTVRANDRFVFKIKESGEKEWKYTIFQEYRKIYDWEIYFFSFQPIEDSQNKEYVMEISLESDSPNIFARISPEPSNLSSLYQFDKNELTFNPPLFVDFLKKKYDYTLKGTNFIPKSLTFLIPFIFYCLYNFLKEAKVAKKLYGETVLNNTKVLKFLPLVTLLFMFSSISLGVEIIAIYLLAISLWIFSIYRHKMSSADSYISSLIFLLLSSVFMSLNMDIQAEKMSIWCLILLILGLIQNSFELNKPLK